VTYTEIKFPEVCMLSCWTNSPGVYIMKVCEDMQKLKYNSSMNMMNPTRERG